MNRVDKIKAYKTQQEERAIQENIQKENTQQVLMQKVCALQPRIAELIETANACLANGIEIDRYGKRFDHYYDRYEHGSFFTNGISHRVGFVKKGCASSSVQTVVEMGINAGGACGHYNFRTDGKSVYSVNEDDSSDIVSPNIHYMERFLQEFDTFETAFYNYVDNIIGK